MIINSLLDTDLYKLTMMQSVLHQFPGTNVTYEFKCRNSGIDLKPIIKEVKEEIKHLCTLHFSEEELSFLNKLSFISTDFIQFLRIFKLNEDFITISEDDFGVTIKGPWLHTILFEVPVLSIINEVYFRYTVENADFEKGRRRLNEKIDLIKDSNSTDLNFKFSDFGTRRRFSRQWHKDIVSILKNEVPGNLFGTSNVLLAKDLDLTPIGTMAHEWLMACQNLGPKLADSQKHALEVWVQEYRGDLGIALSDVVGFDAFLNDFDLYFAKLFDGCRHDSGDPYDWCSKLIAHYKKLKINPMTKNAVFSDGLNFKKAIDIASVFKGKILTSFGIGTNLTNDLGYTPLQIVIKMVECENSPVAKISDSSGKQMCNDPDFLKYLKKVYKIQGDTV
ncbi:MAG: nicotinate phosphoribosyltransferase [Deltaproteobacteria bacterium]|nr:nicotinate phosphoribosyltransferase [Deltaproteobacteria bacterium]